MSARGRMRGDSQWKTQRANFTKAASKLLPELGVIPGFALDLTTADADGKLWHFDNREMRDRAMERVRREKPMLLIGSPMCTAFSTWQRINDLIRDKDVVAAEKKRAVVHLEFCVELYREQLRHGRYFLHEHPAFTTSWKEPAVMNLLQHQDVERIRADQCQLGQQTLQGDPVKKPTGFMSNAPELLRSLSRRCFGKHGLCSRRSGDRHAEGIGKVAQPAAIFQ